MKNPNEISFQDKNELRKVFRSCLPSKQSFRSYQVWSLLISNLLVAIFVIAEDQSALNVLWIYWFQSVIIGVFNFFKILSLKDYTTNDLKVNGRTLKKSKSAKTGVAIFFLFHYGIFHVVYAIFLSTFVLINNEIRKGIDYTFILLTSLVFFINYFIEFIFSYRTDQEMTLSLSKVMFAPYKRIIPMHITIILAGFVITGGAISNANPNHFILLVFICLKSFIDLITHS